jgi:hypothetical protein
VAIALHPQDFQVSGCCFLPFYDYHFPEIDSGKCPPSTMDPEDFSPFLEILNGFVWHLDGVTNNQQWQLFSIGTIS